MGWGGGILLCKATNLVCFLFCFELEQVSLCASPVERNSTCLISDFHDQSTSFLLKALIHCQTETDNLITGCRNSCMPTILSFIGLPDQLPAGTCVRLWYRFHWSAWSVACRNSYTPTIHNCIGLPDQLLEEFIYAYDTRFHWSARSVAAGIHIHLGYMISLVHPTGFHSDW